MELATPQHEIYDKLSQLGWELSKVNFRGGYYYAKAKNPQSGQEIERKGNSPEMAVAAVYQHAIRATEVRQRSMYARLSAWQQDWYDQMHEIAKAYAGLPQFEERATEAWQSLGAESKAQAAIIRKQIDVKLTPEFQPYETPEEMRKDVNTKSRLSVSTGETHHPLWDTATVIDFRVCHDVLGICQTGGGWSWPGANKAVLNHMPNLSPEAQEALFVEIIGRVAYETVYRGLGGAKVALMTDFLDPVREAEGNEVQVPKVGGVIPVDPTTTLWRAAPEGGGSNVPGATFYTFDPEMAEAYAELHNTEVEGFPASSFNLQNVFEVNFDNEADMAVLMQAHSLATGQPATLDTYYQTDPNIYMEEAMPGFKQLGYDGVTYFSEGAPGAEHLAGPEIVILSSDRYSTRLAMPYHVSPRSLRENIEQEGIQPQNFSGDIAPLEDTYYWDTQEQADAFGHNVYRYEEPYDVWQFDLEPGEEPQGDPWFDDFTYEDNPAFFNEDRTPGAHKLPHGIAPERIKRVGSPALMEPPAQTIAPPQFDFDNWSVLENDSQNKPQWQGSYWGPMFDWVVMTHPDIAEACYKTHVMTGSWSHCHEALVTLAQDVSPLNIQSARDALAMATPEQTFQFRFQAIDNLGHAKIFGGDWLEFTIEEIV